MSRPLIQRRIDELEAMFAEGQGDASTLRLLEAELAQRSMPRAVSLFAKVKRSLSGAPSLFEGPLDLGGSHLSGGPACIETERATSTPQGMTFNEALRILKTTSASPWEEIEATRRQIVERARPDRMAELNEKQRALVKGEAQRANYAYLTLARQKQR